MQHEKTERQMIAELRHGGQCCAQVIAAMGLRLIGEENPLLVRALRGLCGGCGGMCGALSGALCVLSLFEEDNDALDFLTGELKNWFEVEYGSFNCWDIVQNNPARKSLVCPPLIEEVYFHLKELLQEAGKIA